MIQNSLKSYWRFGDRSRRTLATLGEPGRSYSTNFDHRRAWITPRAIRPPTLSTPGPSIRYALIEFPENDSWAFPARRSPQRVSDGLSPSGGRHHFFSTIFLSIALSSHRLGQQRRLASESRVYIALAPDRARSGLRAGFTNDGRRWRGYTKPPPRCDAQSYTFFFSCSATAGAAVPSG